MIKKVVLTGGPGSGKTTVIENVKKYFRGKYKVIVVDETASYLINMGIRPFGEDAIPLIDFQELVLKMQIAKEDIINRSLDFLKDENILIIYDRAIIDGCAYIDSDSFEEILNRLDKKQTINDFLGRYDLIINLVSRKDFYTKDNNPARSEDVDEALELGNRTLNSWVGHKNMKIVYPKDTVEEKIHEVINYINNILKEKEVKQQEKYLVDLSTTDINYLKEISKVAHIEQTYLQSDETVEKRLRKITFNDNTTYNYTVYKSINNNKIKVSDEQISERIYKKLLDFKDLERETIIKDRYYFPYKDQYFNLDIIDDYGILEINVIENEKLELPSFINILEQVTSNPDYLNKNIASKKNKQLVKK